MFCRKSSAEVAVEVPKVNTTKYPVLHFKPAEGNVKSGDQILAVYVDYNAVIYFYTMGGGMLTNSWVIKFCFWKKRT